MPMNYYSCSNKNPDLHDKNQKHDFPYFEMISIILHLFIRLRITLFQRRKKIGDNLNPIIWMQEKNLFLRQIEIQSIADFTSNVVGLAMCSFYTLIAKRINLMDLREINTPPNSGLMNIFQLFCPGIISCSISIVYYSRHPLLRKTMLRELKNCFSFD
jgi:hypothetical protein